MKDELRNNWKGDAELGGKSKVGYAEA
jgi:hypothetical protein